MKKKLKEPILAEGEVTGHAHKLKAKVEVFENEDKTREFNLKEPTDLVHEEHKPVTLPAKELKSDKVEEYDHFAEEARKVVD